MFSRWFRRRKPKQPEPPGRDVEELARGIRRPAVHIVATIPRGTSFFGGAPSIAPDPWPSKNGKRLDFLAQIDLAQAQAVFSMDGLPKRGALLVFYDVQGNPWGFDPKDQGGWAVIHQDVSSGDLTPHGSTDRAEPAHGRVPVSFRLIHRYPSWERGEVEALQLSETESEALSELADREFNEQPRHHLGGFPDPIQGDWMERECQLASNGIFCGDEKYLKDPRVPELEKGAADWRLLLQLDSDTRAGFSWGDCGMLYFFVREQDLRAGDLSKVWMISQCH